jgi:hypothetical protein
LGDRDLLGLLIGIVLFMLLILIAAMMFSSKKHNSLNDKVNKRVKSNFFIKSYHFFSKFKLLKRYLLKIRGRIEMLDLSDNWTINKKTMQFIYVSLGLSIVLFGVVLLMQQRLYYTIIGLLTIYIIHNQIIKLLVEKLDDKLLYQFERFLGDIRHHYHEHGMIDEAIYDSIEESDYEVSHHAEKIYEVLTSEDAEEKQAEYNDLVPNKYFKTFLALCYTVLKFGDKIIDGKSMFLTNLNYLKQEINLETLRRRKLNYLFKSLAVIAILPIFFLSAIENWAKGNLPELRVYYEGAYGFVVQIVLFIIVILSFELINKMQSNQEVQVTNYSFQEIVFKNKRLYKTLHGITLNHFSKAMKYEDMLKITGTKMTVEGFYMKRLIYASIGFLLSVIVFINVQHIVKYNILYSSQPLLVQEEVINQEVETDIVAFDRAYILKYYRKGLSYADMEQVLMMDNKVVHKRMIPSMAIRILDKLERYENQYFKWWQLIICICIGGIFYYIPYWMLLFRRSVMYMNMEDEVMQFHTIILMLMNIERISVEDLLQWIGVFAFIFKESIQKCLNNYENGDMRSLEQLKTDEPFMPFVRIVENLQAATDKISISEAFDELKIERGYYQEKRKQDHEMIVSKKGTWGKIIAFIPLTGTLILYLITPFIHLSITQFINYSNQIKVFL